MAGTPIAISGWRSSRVRETISCILCCFVLVLGVCHVAFAFLEHTNHPGWDFVLRHSEATCLKDLRTDPHDIFLGVVQDKFFLPYHFKYEFDDNVLEYRWVIGYPPWEYTLMLPLSFLSLELADSIFKGMEIAALVFLVFFSSRRSARIRAPLWKRLLLAYSVFLLPSDAWYYIFRSGNWSLLFCAGAICLVISLDRKREILAGFVWAFLMIKPQQGIWFAVPLLLRRQFKTIGVAALTCLVASVPPALLCGKTPLELIMEIPKLRLQPFFATALFPPQAFSLVDEYVFPNAALPFGAMLCFGFCLWASWKIRKEGDWFVFLQPTFLCVCAGYPLWHQDWLFYFFPLFFLLETWMGERALPKRIRYCSLLVAVVLLNPLSWIRRDFSWIVGVPMSEVEILAWSTWLLLAFFVRLVQAGFLSPSNHSDSILVSSDVPASPTNESCLGNESRNSIVKSIFPFFIAILLILVCVAFLKNDRLLGIDDADIFLGYAKNLCDGRGISYAMNGVPCEGTTSLLWLLLCALSFSLHLGEAGILAVSLFLLFASQWIWMNTLCRVLPPRRRSPLLFFVYSVILLSSAGYVTWMSITLMDTVLWGFLLAWITSILVTSTSVASIAPRRLIASAIPFALAPWARPEAMLVVPCAISLAVLFRFTHGKSLRAELFHLAAFLLSLSVLTGFRMWYFGYPLPNTYYAKVSPSIVYNIQEGTQYALGYLRSGVFPYLFSICLAVAIIRMIIRLFRKGGDNNGDFNSIDFLWMWCVVLMLPPILSGGDHFKYYRFFQPVWPMVCVMLVYVFSLLPVSRPPRKDEVDIARVIVLFTFVLFSVFSGWRWKPLGCNPGWPRLSPLRNEFSIAEEERKNGILLSRLFRDWEPRPVLGVICGGGISRMYRGPIVDLMGLNNTTIAHYPGKRFGVKNHAAFEPELFASLQVDLMPFEPSPFRSRTLKGMLETESFVSNWRCGQIRKDATGEETPPFFVENGFLARLLSTGEFSFRDSYRFEDGKWKEIKEDSVVD